MALVKTVIEINGRQYNARTGELLNSAPVASNPAQPVKQPIAAPPQQRAGVALDGVSKHRRAPSQTMRPAVPVASTANKQVVRNTQPSTVRSLDIKPTHRKPQKAQTLLRGVVKKPQKVSPQVHSTSTIAHSNVERSATGRGLLLKRSPDSRLARAKLTAKSMSIRKFGVGATNKKPRLSGDLTVEAAPSASHTVPQVAPVITKPVLSTNNQKEHVFNHSIAQATHHNDPKVKKEKFTKRFASRARISPRLLGAGAAICAVLVLGSFFAYQNIPAVAMRVAASKAGFAGHMPSNAPAGFSFQGPVKYSKGNIALTYSSNSDDRSFVISQKPTDWTSESLLANHILATKTRYQTYHDKGLTVFIYNDGNATWVDKGVWYNIRGEGSLSSDQILSIAGSM